MPGRRPATAPGQPRGRVVTTHHHPDGSIQAAEANAADAEVYIGLPMDPGPPLLHLLLRRLSLLVARGTAPGRAPCQGACRVALDCPTGGSQGMSLPLLRETRMPAVISEIGPATVVVEQAATVARAIVEALSEWADTPVD